MVSHKHKIRIYTDGACLGNPGRGGYAAILRYPEHSVELTDAFRMTTNNRMELLAVVIALESLKEATYHIDIYSDSRYVVDAVEKGWLRKWTKTNFQEKKNPDLWKRFLPLYATHRPHLHWIKGHAGHAKNERCDTLAVETAQKGPWHIDPVYENTSQLEAPS